jgi:alkylhydroperoxidase family enzyme
VRFAVAKQDGLTEDLVQEITDDFQSSELSARHKATVALADAFINAEGPPSPEVQAQIQAEFSPAEIAEIAVGLALFHGFSKLLIAVGAEPTDMPTTILPTPS